MISGQLHVVMTDGTELDIVPDDAYEIPPGHDAWVVGEDTWDTVEFTSARNFAIAPEAIDERVLLTILFTDIVDSTATIGQVGDRAWQALLLRAQRTAAGCPRSIPRAGDRHDRRRLPGPVRRSGPGGPGGMGHGPGGGGPRLSHPGRAPHRRGRHCRRPGPRTGGACRGSRRRAGGTGEVLVSATTRDLLDGSDLAFVDRGEHELKGLVGARRIYALAPARSEA